MASSPLTEPLVAFAGRWRAATDPSRRRLAFVIVALVWLLALLLARQGTSRARIAAAALITGSAALAVGARWRARRRLRRPEHIVRALTGAPEREPGDRLLRALSLIGPDGDARDDGTSGELARLHVARAIEQFPSERIVARAARRAARVGVAALIVALCAVGLALSRPWSVLEGADVLVARGGLAPASMRWLDDAQVFARPPDYLHLPERTVPGLASVPLPYGTQITVRGSPTHAGRRLLLSDGSSEVPFTDDGAGGVVARWPLRQSAGLRVLARFGDVAISEPEALFVESVPDLAPAVTLEGAPRRLLLLEQTEDTAIRYEATDDHGLREVDLVLRSGTREERRVLARLDGEARSDKGGYVLKLRDGFVKKSHVPVEVTIEARDNDPLTGPKWGASAAITLVPPDVGEPEARRAEALRRLRDALVDSLAWRLSSPAAEDRAARRAHASEEKRRAAADAQLVDETLAQTQAGVRLPLRVRATLVGQSDKLRQALDRELSASSDAAHAAVVKATERFVLVTDAVLRGLGLRDARDSARLLADVADDLALGAAEASGGSSAADEARTRATARMDAAASVLSGGARTMPRLGELGRDLGEIIDADLLRVDRARRAENPSHAELAARDLAARLREPDPSFGARGNGLGRAGGESGGGRGTPGEEQGSSDDVDQAFEEAARDIEQLAQDHAGEIGKMEQALAGATGEQEIEQLREEARRHAEAIREAARGLPSVGNGSDSWTSKGALARELAEQMARSLEQAQAGDAVQSGRSALGALDEAKKMLQRGGWLEDPSGHELRRVEDARRALDAEEKWAEQVIAQARRRAAERARKQLEQGGDEEGRLADRARDIGQRQRERGALPEPAVESLDDAERAAREAAEALKQGEADKGLERQREAQRHLEAASEQLRGDEEDASGGSSTGPEGARDTGSQSVVNVPKPGDHKGPEDFRRRVVQGLGQPAGGSLKDAVRRYAEGLLR